MMKGWSLTLACALFTFLTLTLILRSPKSESQIDFPINAATEISEPDMLKMQAGLTALEGEGIIVEMDDGNRAANADENPNLYIIHDDDVLRVVNELRAAGAEAVSINGQRLIETSEIRCAGPTLSVNNVRSAAPFIISAIGDKVALENAIEMRGGVRQTLSVWGIRIEVKPSDEIYIPPFDGTRQFTHAQLTRQKKIFASN